MKKQQKINKKTLFVFKGNGFTANYSTDPTDPISTSISGGNLIFVKRG
ncbi:hypothetical protein ACFOG5_03910 [Pedobacter fastidiosus]|uniref:Uncharacterized protein n=1 Tax=Pedobacter fastidiosus TaxID=2765361 RepID=A0ABR7KMV2_9SPHI|nr:hypothetical protein [Pedobacter fastidiosus]MBC6109406.1 hypothetical protein [Pedobacter fastidiosus]